MKKMPITPSLEQELERWQEQSVSKIPPGEPRHLLHELPRLAVANEAAAGPTIDEEVPLDPPAPNQTELEGELVVEEDGSADREQALDEDAAIERFKDGTTRAEDAGAETNPSAVG